MEQCLGKVEHYLGMVEQCLGKRRQLLPEWNYSWQCGIVVRPGGAVSWQGRTLSLPGGTAVGEMEQCQGGRALVRWNSVLARWNSLLARWNSVLASWNSALAR